MSSSGKSGSDVKLGPGWMSLPRKPAAAANGIGSTAAAAPKTGANASPQPHPDGDPPQPPPTSLPHRPGMPAVKPWSAASQLLPQTTSAPPGPIKYSKEEVLELYRVAQPMPRGMTEFTGVTSKEALVPVNFSTTAYDEESWASAQTTRPTKRPAGGSSASTSQSVTSSTSSATSITRRALDSGISPRPGVAAILGDSSKASAQTSSQSSKTTTPQREFWPGSSALAAVDRTLMSPSSAGGSSGERKPLPLRPRTVTSGTTAEGEKLPWPRPKGTADSTKNWRSASPPAPSASSPPASTPPQQPAPAPPVVRNTRDLSSLHTQKLQQSPSPESSKPPLKEPEEPSKVEEPQNDTDQLWTYKDPHGNVQGPFSKEQLLSWLEAQYYQDDLPVKRPDDAEFVELGVAFGLRKSAQPPGFETRPGDSHSEQTRSARDAVARENSSLIATTESEPAIDDVPPVPPVPDLQPLCSPVSAGEMEAPSSHGVPPSTSRFAAYMGGGHHESERTGSLYASQFEDISRMQSSQSQINAFASANQQGFPNQMGPVNEDDFRLRQQGPSNIMAMDPAIAHASYARGDIGAGLHGQASAGRTPGVYVGQLASSGGGMTAPLQPQPTAGLGLMSDAARLWGDRTDTMALPHAGSAHHRLHHMQVQQTLEAEQQKQRQIQQQQQQQKLQQQQQQQRQQQQQQQQLEQNRQQEQQRLQQQQRLEERRREQRENQLLEQEIQTQLRLQAQREELAAQEAKRQENLRAAALQKVGTGIEQPTTYMNTPDHRPSRPPADDSLTWTAVSKEKNVKKIPNLNEMITPDVPVAAPSRAIPTHGPKDHHVQSITVEEAEAISMMQRATVSHEPRMAAAEPARTAHWNKGALQDDSVSLIDIQQEEARRRHEERQRALEKAAASQPPPSASASMKGAWGGAGLSQAGSASLRDQMKMEEEKKKVKMTQPEAQTVKSQPINSSSPWLARVTGGNQGSSGFAAPKAAPIVAVRQEAPPPRPTPAPQSSPAQHEDVMFWETATRKQPTPNTSAVEQPVQVPGNANQTPADSATAFGTKMSAELEKWCQGELKKLNGSTDTTLMEFLLMLTSASEIKEYVEEYLGSSREASAFAEEFILRKDFETGDDVTSGSQAGRGGQSSGVAGKRKGRRQRGARMDPSLLGFTTTNSSRIMQGTIESPDQD